MTLTPKKQICEIRSQNWNVLQFLWNLALELMEHANYKYSTWMNENCNSGKFGSKIEMYSNFHDFGTQDIFKFLLIRLRIWLKD